MKCKIMILLTILGLSTSALACQISIIYLPDGSKAVCYVCNDGKFIKCDPLI